MCVYELLYVQWGRGIVCVYVCGERSCGERGVVGAVEGEAACVERGSMCVCVEMESMRV